MASLRTCFWDNFVAIVGSVMLQRPNSSRVSPALRSNIHVHAAREGTHLHLEIHQRDVSDEFRGINEVVAPSHHVTRSIEMERIWKSRITNEGPVTRQKAVVAS